MHNTQQLLDAAKSRQGLPSDYKLGVVLGLADSAISNYRKGRSHPDDATALKLAELAGLDAGYTVACMHAARAKDDRARLVWIGVAERLQRAGVAAAVILSLGLFSGGPDGGAMASTAQPSQAQHAGGSVYYVNRLRNALALIARKWRQLFTFMGDSGFAAC